MGKFMVSAVSVHEITSMEILAQLCKDVCAKLFVRVVFVVVTI